MSAYSTFPPPAGPFPGAPGGPGIDPPYFRLRPGQVRVAIGAIVLGGWGALAFLALLLTGDLFPVVFADFERDPVLSTVVLMVPVAGGIGFAQLVFYGIRLAGAAARPAAAAVNLRMIRIVTAVELVIGLLIVAAAQIAESPLLGTLVFFAAAAWSAGCCFLLIAARRAAWAVAVLRGASLAPTPGHAFQVLMPGAAPPPPLSAPHAAPQPHAAPAAEAPHDDGLRHWETALLALVILVTANYLFHVPAFFLRLDSYLRPTFWQSLLSGKPVRPSVYGLLDSSAVVLYMGDSRAGSGASLRVLIVATAFMGACWLAWVVWGVTCLVAGPVLRRSAVALAGVMLGLTLLATALHLSELYRARVRAEESRAAYSFRNSVPTPRQRAFVLRRDRFTESVYGDFRNFEVMVLRTALSQTVFPLLLLVLLRRPQVKALFASRPRHARQPRAGP